MQAPRHFNHISQAGPAQRNGIPITQRCQVYVMAVILRYHRQASQGALCRLCLVHHRQLGHQPARPISQSNIRTGPSGVSTFPSSSMPAISAAASRSRPVKMICLPGKGAGLKNEPLFLRRAWDKTNIRTPEPIVAVSCDHRINSVAQAFGNNS